ncbi:MULTISPECIES: hypothetical protein [unclassified Cohnella]|uniref:hypothetical protein n=1 Tax=unclassified Cohnella TaxID=2636738 RepID=UPI00117BF5B3|nr:MULTISPECIES: hypothetical protein [unclassified Cohnella]
MFVKDFKLSRTIFVAGLVLNALIAILTFYLGRAAEDPLLMFIPLAIGAVAHAFYAPAIVVASLATESRHLALWLNNPQSAIRLLASKIANGVLLAAISLVMLYALSGLLLAPKISLIEPYWTDAWKLGLFAFPHILLTSAALGVAVTALWALSRGLRLKIGRWSRTATAGAAILFVWLGAAFESSAPYRFLTEWGGVAYRFPSILTEPLQTYTGEYVYTEQIRQFVLVMQEMGYGAPEILSGLADYLNNAEKGEG